jgi:hypothetical protein
VQRPPVPVLQCRLAGAPVPRLVTRPDLEALMTRFVSRLVAGPPEWNHSLTVRGAVNMRLVAHAE